MPEVWLSLLADLKHSGLACLLEPFAWPPVFEPAPPEELFRATRSRAVVSGTLAVHFLCLSHYYPPEVGALSARMSENAKAWVAAGAKVTIVTCAPNYPRGEIFPGYRNRFFQRETVDGVDIIRLWTFLARNEGFLLRILNYFSFLVSVVIAAPWLPRPDVVLSTSPNLFCGAAGGLLAGIKRRPWLLEIRDLWPESIIAVGAIRRRALLKPFEWLERWAYRHAAAIVSVTDSYVPHLTANGAQSSKIRVIKNGVDLQRFRGADSRRFRGVHRLEGKIVAAYVGTHGLAHGLEVILSAADRLRHRTDIVFMMVGDGAARVRLLQMCDRLQLRNVIFTGELPASRIPEVMAASDISLVVLSGKTLFKKVIPSKMFEAMAAAKPIVLGVEGEAAGIVAAADAGIPIRPEDTAELTAAIERLADCPELRERMGRSGESYVRRNFDRRQLGDCYREFLEQVARGQLEGQAVARCELAVSDQSRI